MVPNTWPAWLLEVSEQEGKDLLENEWMYLDDVRELEKKDAVLEIMRMAKEDHRQAAIDKRLAKFSRERSPPPPATARRRLKQ